MSDKEVLSQEEKAVVETVLRFEAISLKHLASYVLQGNHRQTYDAVASLRKKKWLLVRDAPEDGREKYVVLAKRGVERCYPELRHVTSYGPYANRRRAERILARTDVYFRLLNAGVPEHSIKGREHLLARLSLKAAETVAIWGIEVDGKLYPVYLRKKRVRSQMLNAIQRVNKQQAEGHLVVYKEKALLKQDRTVFLESMPASLCWLIDLTEPTELAAVITHLSAPTAWMRELWANLLPLYPDSRVTQTNPAVPFHYAWFNNGKMYLLGDLACNNIGVASLARSLNRANLEALWGASGVILRVLSAEQARTWAVAMNYPEWVCFAVQGAPERERLLSCHDKRLVLCVKRSTGSDG